MLAGTLVVLGLQGNHVIFGGTFPGTLIEDEFSASIEQKFFLD
jgi:hypothetical protein